MQISQMFKRKPCVFSIECFPPKQTANFGNDLFIPFETFTGFYPFQ